MSFLRWTCSNNRFWLRCRSPLRTDIYEEDDRVVLEMEAPGLREEDINLLGKTGWRIAPAFDVNPNIDKAEHGFWCKSCKKVSDNGAR